MNKNNNDSISRHFKWKQDNMFGFRAKLTLYLLVSISVYVTTTAPKNVVIEVEGNGRTCVCTPKFMAIKKYVWTIFMDKSF